MNPFDMIFSRVSNFGGGLFDESFVEVIVLSLLVSFILGQLNAWFYMWSHRGISYSRTFTQSLVLISMIAAMSMSFVRLDVIAVFGLLGGLAIIRFRTVVRDARDTAYILLSLVCGMASGFGFHEAAVVGSVSANLVALYLHRTEFGSWKTREGLLRFAVSAGILDSKPFRDAMKRYCSRYSVISVDQYDLGDDSPRFRCAYNVRLRDPDGATDFVDHLSSAFQIEEIHLLASRENEEVS